MMTTLASTQITKKLRAMLERIWPFLAAILLIVAVWFAALVSR